MQAFCNELSKFYQASSMKGVVLMVLHKNETNVFDINKVCMELMKKCFKVRKATFEEIDQNLKTQENGDIYYKGELVSIVYYRVGYRPCDYVSCNKDCKNACWDAKRKL